eukprot:13540429-Alexandrium_andersonii.AAC.1
MTRLAFGISCIVVLVGAGTSASVDSVGLVQKQLNIHSDGLNHTTIAAAQSMMVKLSGLVHILDHALGHGNGKNMHKRQPEGGALEEPPNGKLLERLFECTRSAGIDTTDK